MSRDELTAELAKRYGAFYSKFFTAPSSEIFFHNKTGFSIGIYRLDLGQAFLTDEGKLQASYRIDKGANNV